MWAVGRLRIALRSGRRRRRFVRRQSGRGSRSTGLWRIGLLVPGTRHGEEVVVVVMVVKRRWRWLCMEGQQPRWGRYSHSTREPHVQCNQAKKHRQKHLQEAKKQHRETVARSVNAQLLSISSEGSVYCCWRPSGRTGWRGIGRSTAGDFGGELGEVS